MSEEIVVYWAPSSYPNLQGRMALLNMKPIPLINYLVKQKNKKATADESYQSCTAFREEFNNSYFLTYPVSTSIEFDENGSVKKDNPDSGWYIDRASSFENSYAVDLDLGIVFFSEESLKMRITPPFMHKTQMSDYGFMMSGGFDISSWFRSYQFTHQLWPGVNNLKTIEGEAAAYVFFDTNKKVILKQFLLTDKLFNYIQACVDYKKIKKFIPFSELYYKFKEGNLNKLVLNEIKKNLVE